jgi:hypothetical protein
MIKTVLEARNLGYYGPHLGHFSSDSSQMHHIFVVYGRRASPVPVTPSWLSLL